MAVDFSIGALIGIIVPGAVARKVASNEAKIQSLMRQEIRI